ncbi:pseudaminic acid cytidylyltransferase [Microvirga sp. TS319]|uniref:pseudaminic acid cytidylyltransferase n=1 Tax=Microvirga sp. TS319 TaxID=3241165 RepID=UPI003519E869
MKAAVIPARGGSKRIPGKNVKPFAGKPMLAYAVSAVLESGLFDIVAVSSEDPAILALGRELGARPLLRPAALADDWTPTVPVIAHAIAALEEGGTHLETVCCVYPAVPFLQRKDLVEALSLLERTGAEYAFPVVRFPSAIQRALRLSGDGRITSFNPDAVNIRTQDLEPAFYDAGQFYWGRRDAWAAGLPVHANGFGLVVPEWRVVDIDTPDDWRRAEIMHRALSEDTSAPRGDA